MTVKFTKVDPTEVPDAEVRRRANDDVIDAALDEPGSWFLVETEYASKATAGGIAKAYKDVTSEDGGSIQVRTKKVGDKWRAYVAFVYPEDEADTAEEA